MQIKQINFVKASEVPVSMKNTELSQVAVALVEKLNTAQPGQALSFTLDNSSKFTRYALQRKVQKLGGQAVIRAGKGKHEFFAVRAAQPAAKK